MDRSSLYSFVDIGVVHRRETVTSQWSLCPPISVFDLRGGFFIIKHAHTLSHRRCARNAVIERNHFILLRIPFSETYSGTMNNLNLTMRAGRPISFCATTYIYTSRLASSAKPVERVMMSSTPHDVQGRDFVFPRIASSSSSSSSRGKIRNESVESVELDTSSRRS